jgi:hypothetical protein
MTERRLRFLDALTFSIRVFRWRPVHSAVYVAAVAGLYLLYYAWAGSEGGTAFFTRYVEATQGIAEGRFGAYFAMMAVTLLASLIAGSVFAAGAYRILVREGVSPWLPLRLGTDELRVMGLYLVLFGMFFVALLAAGIVVAVLTVLVSFLSGGGGAGAGPAGTISLAGMLGMLIAMLYVFGRFAVSLPQSIAERRFSLGGWAASRGFGLQLLLAHGVLYLAMIVVQFMLAPDLMGYTLGNMGGEAATDPSAMLQAMTQPYGNRTLLVVPVQAAFMFLLFGPTAALVSWAGRQAEAGRPAAADATEG